MSNIEKAIKIAVENGWHDSSKFLCISQHDGSYIPLVAFFELQDDPPEEWNRDVLALFSDSLFWQALGKGLGWGKIKKLGELVMPEWQLRWHHFIDHLAQGKDPESFFIELLKNHE